MSDCSTILVLSSALKTGGRRSWAESALAGLLIVLIGVCSTLAHSPSFHQRLHSDANQDHHQCAFTSLQKQQVVAPDPTPAILAAGSGLTWQIHFRHPSVVTDSDSRLAPSRAPPVFSLL